MSKNPFQVIQLTPTWARNLARLQPERRAQALNRLRLHFALVFHSDGTDHPDAVMAEINAAIDSLLSDEGFRIHYRTFVASPYVSVDSAYITRMKSELTYVNRLFKEYDDKYARLEAREHSDRMIIERQNIELQRARRRSPKTYQAESGNVGCSLRMAIEMTSISEGGHASVSVTETTLSAPDIHKTVSVTETVQFRIEQSGTGIVSATGG